MVLLFFQFLLKNTYYVIFLVLIFLLSVFWLFPSSRQILYHIRKYKSSKPKYNFKSVQKLNFSLPYNYMLYIADSTASPKNLEKFQKTCKYFFSRQNILIVDKFIYKNGYEESLYALRKKYWNPGDVFLERMVRMDILPMNAIFWLMRDFECGYNERKGQFYLPSKIYKISLKKINLWNLHLDETQFEMLAFSGKLEKLFLCDVTIHGTKMNQKWTWFQIYEKLPYLRVFFYKSELEITAPETILKLHTVERKVKLQEFLLDIIVSSPFFDIIYLWKFMKDNASPPWTKKRDFKIYKSKWPRMYESEFWITFCNEKLETDYTRANEETSILYQINLAAYPNIIPEYDEAEFFENDVIQLAENSLL